MRFFDKLEEYLVALCLLAMVVLNFGNVLSRYVLKASWSFTGEILLILFVWTIILSSAVAYKRFEHLGLLLIVDKLPKKMKKLFIAFSGLMSSVLVIALAISGFEMVKQQISFNQTTALLSLPEWIAGASIPVGALIILFRVIQSTVYEISYHKEGGQR